jgi:hypothetical protein
LGSENDQQYCRQLFGATNKKRKPIKPLAPAQASINSTALIHNRYERADDEAAAKDYGGGYKYSAGERQFHATPYRFLSFKFLNHSNTSCSPGTNLGSVRRRIGQALALEACKRNVGGESGATRTPFPAQGGQQSGDCGQQVMAA